MAVATVEVEVEVEEEREATALEDLVMGVHAEVGQALVAEDMEIDSQEKEVTTTIRNHQR